MPCNYFRQCKHVGVARILGGEVQSWVHLALSSSPCTSIQKRHTSITSASIQQRQTTITQTWTCVILLSTLGKSHTILEPRYNLYLLCPTGCNNNAAEFRHSLWGCSGMQMQNFDLHSKCCV